MLSRVDRCLQLLLRLRIFRKFIDVAVEDFCLRGSLLLPVHALLEALLLLLFCSLPRCNELHHGNENNGLFNECQHFPANSF